MTTYIESIMKILILEGSAAGAEIIQQSLKKKKGKYEFRLAIDKGSFLEALDEFSPHVILSDNSLPQFDITEAMQIARQHSFEIPFILVTEKVSEEFAANIIKSGADDYILKDHMRKLPAAIDAALTKRRAEEELRKSNERFQYVTQASSDIIWELNFETREYLLHEGKEKIFGGHTSIDWRVGVEGKYIIEADREGVRQSFREAKMDQSRTLWEREYRVYSRDNSIMYIINHAKFIRNEKGKAIRVVGAITDITDRKKLELELLEHHRHEQLKVTEVTLEAQEKERNIIGQELHDNVNQLLVGTKLILSSLNLDHDGKTNQDLVNLAMSNLENAIEENRKLSHRLVTPDMSLESLSMQLYHMSHNMLATSGINIQVHASRLKEELLSDAQKIAIYRIAQEQCTNIIKYANASNVTICLSTVDKHFTMKIADDGLGMQLNKTAKGIGLRNISTRVSIFRGKATVKSSPGHGFILQIEMPVTNPSM